MPTGYTATLMEKGESFQSFVTRCMRAMGVLVSMRDMSLDAKIPKKIVNSDVKYHEKELRKARAEFQRLKKFSLRRQRELGEKRKAAALRSLRSGLKKSKEEQKRLDEMTALVKAWQPPTSDHVRFKTFMLEQLTISGSESTFYEDSIKEVESQNLLSVYYDALSAAAREIKYHKEHLAKAKKNEVYANKWVQAVRKSIKKTPDPTKTKEPVTIVCDSRP